MAGLRDMATDAAQFLGKELQLDAKDIAMLGYGLEFYAITVANFGIIIGVAWCLGILPYVSAALITTSSLRVISGGTHSATFFRCLTLGIVIMITIGKLASTVGMVPQTLLFVLVTFSVISGFYVVHNWAPADTPAKPITSAVRRARFRRLSYIFLVAWAVIMILLMVWGTLLTTALVVASLGGFCWQIFSLTPAGYWFVAAVDVLFEKCRITF